MIDRRQEFLDVLFDFDDKIAFGMDDGSACKPIDPLPDWLYTKANKFCINPLHTWRNTGNVTAINSFLFEIDRDADGNQIPIKQQVKMFLDSGLPYTTMVYSGTKSVHCIVRLTEPVEGDWFRSWWEAINRVLTAKGLPIDAATMKIPQLSRVPGSIRMDKVKDEEGNFKKDDKGNYILVEGNEQKLIHINRRVTQSEIKEWLAENNIEVEAPRVPEPSTYVPGANDAVDNKAKFEKAIAWTTDKGGSYSSSTTTGGHSWLFDLGMNCWKVDLNKDAAVSMAEIEWGTRYLGSNGGGNTNFPVKAGWEFGHNNSVKQYEFKKNTEWTDEEKKEWLKQKRLKQLKLNELILINKK